MTVFKFMPHLQKRWWWTTPAIEFCWWHSPWLINKCLTLEECALALKCLEYSCLPSSDTAFNSARNVMLCMRKEHLLWGYRFCLVLTTSAETNPDKDHALLCVNNSAFHAFMGGWEEKGMILSWVRETSTHAFCRNWEHQPHGLCVHTGPRYNRDS